MRRDPNEHMHEWDEYPEWKTKLADRKEKTQILHQHAHTHAYREIHKHQSNVSVLFTCSRGAVRQCLGPG